MFVIAAKWLTGAVGVCALVLKLMGLLDITWFQAFIPFLVLASFEVFITVVLFVLAVAIVLLEGAKQGQTFWRRVASEFVNFAKG